MFDGTPPSQYWERPEPSSDEVMENATLDADMFVAEWADLTEMELFIDVTVNRSNDPLFTLTLVQQDGIELASPDMEFESIEDLRKWVADRWPLSEEEQ